MANSGYAPAAINTIYGIVEQHIGSARRSGIFANKSGYHNSRNNLKRNWPGDYSLRAPADKRGDGNAAAAIDISFNDRDMKVVTKRLIDACKRNDPRMECVREVLGTLNGWSVTGWNRYGDGTGGSRSKVGYVSSDSSHLWHSHISFFRAYVNDAAKMRGVAEVICGIDNSDKVDAKPVEKPKPASKPKPSAAKKGWYHVDPKKVDTFLYGLVNGKNKYKRKPKYNLYIAKTVTSGGREWAVTNYGTRYAMAYLAKGKSGVASWGKPKPAPKPKAYPKPRTRVVYDDKVKPGVKNSDSVYWVQVALNAISFKGGREIPLTGAYDALTVAEVKKFQAQSCKDPADGDLGPKQTRYLFDVAGISMTHRSKS